MKSFKFIRYIKEIITGQHNYGYNKLKAVLEKSGFVFKASKPEPYYSIESENPYMYTGIFLAENKYR
jgi:hypothetical protein